MQKQKSETLYSFEWIVCGRDECIARKSKKKIEFSQKKIIEIYMVCTRAITTIEIQREKEYIVNLYDFLNFWS